MKQIKYYVMVEDNPVTGVPSVKFLEYSIKEIRTKRTKYWNKNKEILEGVNMFKSDLKIYGLKEITDETIKN